MKTDSEHHSELERLVDHILDEIASGQKTDIEELCERYPEQAEELRKIYPSLVALGSLKATSSMEGGEIADAQGIPEVLGDFRIVGPIGRGGMGYVFEAVQISLGRRVAVKVLPSASFLDSRQLQRFKNESRAAALLQHPNIVKIHSAEHERAIHFYAMEFVDGCDLAEVIGAIYQKRNGQKQNGQNGQKRNGQSQDGGRIAKHSTDAIGLLSTQRSSSGHDFYRSIARLGMQASEALQYAHEAGVVHRDIKPSNLMLDRNGDLHITDFGLAQVQSHEGLTQTGDMIGTLRYMSPEQLEKTTVDHRTDLYSLGLTLYELAVGRPAFERESRQQLVHDILMREPPGLSKLRSDIPKDFQTIIEKAHAKDRDVRYQTAAEMGEDLERFLANRTIKAKPATLVARARRFVVRNPLVTLLLAISTLLFAFLSAGALYTASARTAQLRTRELEVYARDIRLAQLEIDDGRHLEGERLLLKWAKTGAEDHRGLEWDYLWNRIHVGNVKRSFKHHLPLSHSAFSPDGKRIAEAFFSRSIPIWDLSAPSDAMPVANLECDAIEIYITKTYPKQNLLVAGDKVGNVYVWDWDALDERIHTFRCQSPNSTMHITSLDVDHSGRWLAVGCGIEKDKLEVFDLRTGESILKDETLDGDAVAAFDENGDLLVAMSGTKVIRKYNVDSQNVVDEWKLDDEVVGFDLAIEPRLIAVAHESTLGEETQAWVTVYRADDRSELFQYHLPGSRFRSMSFSHAGEQLAIGTRSGEVILVDLKSFSVTRQKLHFGRVTSVVFSPDDETLATTGTDMHMHLVALREDDSQIAAVVEPRELHARKAKGVAFLNENRLCTSRGGHAIDVWDPRTGKSLDTWELEPGHGNYMGLTHHRESGVLAVAQVQWPPIDNFPEQVLFLNSDNGEVIWKHGVPTGLMSISRPFSADGRYFASCGRQWVNVFDLQTRTVRQLEFSTWVKTCAISPDGKVLAVAQTSGPTHFLDIESLEPVREPFVTDETLPDCMDFLPDGRLVVAGLDNRIRVWDWRAAKLVTESAKYPAFFATVRASPDGKRLAVGSMDGKVRMFMTENCEELLSLNISPTYPYFDFSRDGNALAVSAGDRAFVLRGAENRDELRQMTVAELEDIVCLNITELSVDDDEKRQNEQATGASQKASVKQ